jgi:hypothetical protein
MDGGVMRHWEPQEEGMMSTTASFSLSKKPRFVNPIGKRQTQKVMLASFATALDNL